MRKNIKKRSPLLAILTLLPFQDFFSREISCSLVSFSYLFVFFLYFFFYCLHMFAFINLPVFFPPLQISCYPTHITTLLCTFLVIPFSYIPLFLFSFLLLIVSLLPPIFLQSHPPTLLHSSNLPFFPIYHFLL